MLPIGRILLCRYQVIRLLSTRLSMALDKRRVRISNGSVGPSGHGMDLHAKFDDEESKVAGVYNQAWLGVEGVTNAERGLRSFTSLHRTWFLSFLALVLLFLRRTCPVTY